MDAMSYECLIRRAFQCGRYGAPGADADAFRNLERKFSLYNLQKEALKKGQPKLSTKSLEALSFEYGSKAGEIAAYVETAIDKVEKDYENELTAEQSEILEKCKTDLYEPTFESISKSITAAEKVMLELGLYPQ